MTPAISLENVGKHYQRGKERVDVLHGLNLDVPAGEFLALMGPSGSGKTTVLNLVGGLDHADEGEIIVEGARIDQLNAGQLTNWRARHIGFVFQFYYLMPMLSAERNVELPLLLTHLSRAERQKRIGLALDLVGLADRAQHKPNELSGGQQQRVAIARAIVADPTILLCDEPTGDLDRNAAEDIMSILKLLNERQGKTVILVTHDPKVADYASRQLHMDKGQLIDGGRTALQ